MPKPKVATIKNANRGTYGGGVRFTPGDQATARAANQAELKVKITPSADPAQMMLQRVEQGQASGKYTMPNMPQGSPQWFDQLKQHVESVSFGNAPSGDPFRVTQQLTPEAQLNIKSRGSEPSQILGLMTDGDPTLTRLNGGANLYVSSGATPLHQFKNLLHETGHGLLEHGQQRGSRMVNWERETEAESVAGGAYNRRFPWSKQVPDQSQQFIRLIAGSEPNSDPAFHLSDPSVQGRINSAVNKLVPESAPFKTITPALYVQPPVPATAPSSGLRLKPQTQTPRDVATGAPRSSAVINAQGGFEDSFRVNQPGRPGTSMTLSSDRKLNQLLTTTGTSGDSVGLGLSGNVKKPDSTVVTTPQPLTTASSDAPTTKPTKLGQQAGDRLFAPSERQRLSMRGEYVGYGLGRGPVGPLSPQLIKLKTILDFAKKGIYSPEVVRSEVEKAGLQSELRGVRQVNAFFNGIPGGRMWSNSRQENAQLPQGSAMANNRPLPISTQVLGSEGETLDSFRINQPARPGAPQTTRLTPNMDFNTGLKQVGGFAGDSNAGVGGRVSGVGELPKLDPMVKGLGYKLQTPQQTGLPWAVAADPKTGEMLTLKGKPLPPLVGPSFPTHTATPAPVPMGSQESGVRSQESAFSKGFATSTGTTESPQKQSFFKRTPEQTQGMGLGDRVKFGLGRLAGDVASDASRGQYWRYNHPLAIAGSAFERLAGGNKVGGALAGFAGIQALGQTSNQFDLTNPGQAFRPKGFSAAYPVSDSDKTQIAPGPLGYAKELIGRYVFGRNGQMLPYDQFSKERPDVKQEDYQRYSQYLKGGGANGPMPAGTIDVGGFGVLKGNINGINGPEARLAGFSVTPLGAAAGTATATGVASIFNKALRPTALKGLGAVGAGLDFSNRLQEGQSLPQAVTGTGAGIAGGIVGAETGAALGTAIFPGVGTVLGGLAGGIAGGVGAGALADKLEAHKALPSVAATMVGNTLAGPVVGAVAGLLANNLKDSNPVKAITSTVQQAFSGKSGDGSGDAAMSTATDQLLKASAQYKLVRQPDGSIKSVPNDTQTNVRGEVQKIDDGDTYKVRTYNPKTGQYESNNVRLQGADTRETSDHASTGGFQNRMIDKQKRDQGFADNNAVFAQGENDKRAAEKLVPVGSVPYFNGQVDAAHGRPARDVATESGAKDVGKTLVEQGNAVEYKKGGSSGSSSSSGGGGQSDESRVQVARLQYGAAASPEQRAAALAKQTKAKAERDKAYADPNVLPAERLGKDQALKDANTEYEASQGGQGDRNNESQERRTTQTNQTRLLDRQLQNQGQLQNTDLKGQYDVRVADVKGRYDNQGKVIQGEYGVKKEDVKGQYNVRVAQTKGEYQYATSTDTAKINAVGKIQVAGIKADSDAYKAQVGYAAKTDTAQITGGYKVKQEGVKQSGAVNVADIKAGATMGAAKTAADAKVNVAQIGLQGTQYKADATVRVADLTSQRKAESEGSKAAGAYEASIQKSNTALMAADEKNRVARLKALGVY